MRLSLPWPILLAVLAAHAQNPPLSQPVRFSGMSDASAGIVLSSNLFVAASDEDNILRVYDINRPGPPIREFDFNTLLGVTGKSKESDIEGAARIGERIFWITSHGRNKNGKERPERWRFFATDVRVENGQATMTPTGRPCKTLLEALIRDSSFERFGFAKASMGAPKDRDAINIEGLAATRNGQLLIGFRNPIPRRKALIIPLTNPAEVIEGKWPRFGTAIELDLGGLGIRDLAWTGNDYVIIAGPHDGGRKEELYRWNPVGGGKLERLAGRLPSNFNAEAVMVIPGSEKLQLLSDDGAELVEGVEQKELSDPKKRTFRSVRIGDKE